MRKAMCLFAVVLAVCSLFALKAVAAYDHSHEHECEVTVETVKRPSCAEAGSEIHRYYCPECDIVVYEETVEIPVEHNWSEWIEDTSPMCFEDGIEGRYCLICDYSESRPIPAYGEHDMSEWMLTYPATCEYEGMESSYCQRMRQMGGMDICLYEQTRIIPKLDHSMGDWYVKAEPTCYAVGTEARQCSECGFEECRELATLDHAYATTETPATCGQDGQRVVACTNQGCTERTVTVIGATGHRYQDAWEGDADGHWQVCERCGGKSAKEDHVPGAAATEQEPQTCTLCAWELAPVVIPNVTESSTEPSETVPTTIATVPPTESTTAPAPTETTAAAQENAPEAAGNVSAGVIVAAVLAGALGGTAVVFIGKKYGWFKG